MIKGERFINFRPLLFTALSLILGCAIGYFFILGNSILAGVLVGVFLAVIIIAIFLLKKSTYVKKVLFLIPFLCLFALYGGVSTYVTLYRFDSIYIPEMEYEIEGKIVQIDTTYKQDDYNKTTYILDDITLNGEAGAYSNYKLAIYVDGTPAFEVGDRIYSKGEVNNQSLFYNSDFNVYYAKEGVKIKNYSTAEELLLVKDGKNIFYRARLFIENSLSVGLSGDTFGVARGMLLGNTDDLSLDTLESFRYAGVAHIFAVSGLHIGFLSGVLTFIFNKLKVKKYISLPITVLCLFFYAGICGFTVSSLRAAIMFSFMASAGVFNAKYDALSSISFASIVILTLFPLELFSAGFLLSFTVTLFIILLTRPITNFYNKCISFVIKKKTPVEYNSIQNKVSSAFAVSTASFLAGVPLCLIFFNYISPLSILVNIIFIPVASVVFVALLVLTVLGGIFNVSYYLLYPVGWVLYFMNYLFWQVDAGRFLISADVFLPLVVTFYASLMIMAGLINLNKKLVTILTSSLFILSMVGTIIFTYMTYNAVKVYAFTDSGASGTIYVTKDSEVLVVSEAKSVRTGSLKRLLNNEKIDNVGTIIVSDKDADLYELIDYMQNYFELKTLYHNVDDYSNVVSFYNGVKIKHCTTSEVLTVDDFTIKYVTAGYGVEVFANDDYFLTFSELPEGALTYFKLDGDYKYIASVNYAFDLSSLYKMDVVSFSLGHNYNTVQNGYVKDVIY